jgi:hypothetical protein
MAKKFKDMKQKIEKGTVKKEIKEGKENINIENLDNIMET